MKRVLILGALAGQVDAVDALREIGAEVHVCGHIKSGPGVDAADHFHIADITDRKAIGDLARSIEADLIYSVGSDIAMPTVVAVSEELGLPYFHGSELTTVLRQKELLRRVLGEANLSPVQFTSVALEADIPQWNVYPSIVKPVDAQGQRGITVIDNSDELEDAVRIARESSVSGSVIIEEFLIGPEVSAHVIVKDGEIVFFLPSDRHVWQGPLVGVPEAHSLPLRSETQVWADSFRSLVADIVEVLDVEDGPLYVQSIFTERGPRIIEIASRLDGCHLWRLVKASTGIDILDAVLGRLLGKPWPEFPPSVLATAATLKFFLDAPETVVTREYIDSLVDPQGLFVQIQVEEGHVPRRTNDVISRIGYEIVRGTP